MKPINVLISLHRGYGLGDAVQMSAVLQHVRKHRPHWRVDYVAEPGRHGVGRGIAHRTFSYGAPPYPSVHYDAEVQIILYDTWANWGDRPNTRVSSCLHERFGLGWDAECGRYRVDVSEDNLARAEMLLLPILRSKLCGGARSRSGRSGKQDRGVVAVHYEGDSSPGKKNLTHAQALAVCNAVEKLGRIPILLDWRDRSPLPDSDDVPTVGRFQLAPEWGGDAEMNCALIAQCEAFVGIDSGPGKCASATDTPALIVWTGHHPAPFHDPAPNTTHLVPDGYHGLEPVCNSTGVVDWFEKHYNVTHYSRDPVGEIREWLGEVLT